MRRFANSSARPVSFVFFPMNPIQSGMSDLASAYRLFRLVGHELDFRVWEADPDVDGVLYFLRRVHAAITVRFHASIFALSQGIPTIGVDYFPGVGGKVLELFSDLQREDDARVMDALTAEWVAERLRAACG
jgi:polysaccharide pyruvyl transferase WcaK-like protein